MNFRVTEDALRLGIKVIVITIKGIRNTIDNEEFNELKLNTLKEIRSSLSLNNIENDKILSGFWKLHEKVGNIDGKEVPSPVSLLTTLLTTEGLPYINLIVDIYNLVSIKTRLSIGAHDISKIAGNVTLTITENNETFLPIGYIYPKVINKGEYVYIDDSKEILCRMEVKQSENTKVDETTTDCLYIIQGNEFTSAEYIKEAAHQLINLTTKYCGGTAEIIYNTHSIG